MKTKLFVLILILSMAAITGCSNSKSSSDTATSNTNSATVDAHTVEAIKSKGTISFATESAYAPYAFKDKDGNVVGFEPTMMQAIADELGVKLDIQDMAFDSVIPSVQSGLVDIGIAALTPTQERKEALNMTDVYWQGGQKALVRSEDAEKYADESCMNGITVGAQKSSYQQQVTDEYYADTCTTRYLETVPLMVSDLKAKNVDVLVMDGINAVMYAQENDDLKVTFDIPQMPGEDGGNSMAIMKGNDDLTTYINSLISGWIADGTMEQWFNDAVALQTELGVE
ncbi:MAG: transporter substrate-binding domain-containing protein [Herbinix sp.]|nr:transporter substrate-binding domain-containing protein [Herbinix sp.]